jgi:hypothetical protein
MSQVHGWWGWALWYDNHRCLLLTLRIPTIVCAANLGLCVSYWAYERSLPKEYQPALGKNARQVEGWSKRYFGLKSLFQL